MKKNNLSWKLLQNVRDHAMSQGEGIIELSKIASPPVEVFDIIKKEKLLHAEGADFGLDFDGRLEYLGHKYLLAYNTKYNRDPFDSARLHHPRVRFTIAHELGHFYIENHRNILRSGKIRYTCTTERFLARKELELQADYFATGLLMPSRILSPLINSIPEPNLPKIKDLAGKFQVSLTSMMLRWVKLSHFPCGVFSVDPDGTIAWGWLSDPLMEINSSKKHDRIDSKDAGKFLASSSFDTYSESAGKGLLSNWVSTQHDRLSVEECYCIMPYFRSLLVFIYAYEDELMSLSENGCFFDN